LSVEEELEAEPVLARILVALDEPVRGERAQVAQRRRLVQPGLPRDLGQGARPPLAQHREHGRCAVDGVDRVVAGVLHTVKVDFTATVPPGKRRFQGRRYARNAPRSTLIAWPVISDAAGDARKR